MKNTFLTAAAVLALSVAANAQTTPATQQTPATQPATTQPATTTQSTTVQSTTTVAPATVAPATTVNGQANTISAQLNQPRTTVDSIRAKYQYLPMPEAWTTEKKFPVLGTYQLNGADATAASLSITPDSASKGIVWISGLPQGTVKAYLAKSPATYRIIPQKTAEGKSVPEGTLVFSPETNTLNIALGAPFNTADPASIFPVAAAPAAAASTVDAAVASAPAVATVKVKNESGKSKVKSKSKVTYYTATKVNALNNTGSNAAFGQQLQQSAQQQ